MKYHYTFARRWFRWTSDTDVRCHRPPKGWRASAYQLDYHPVTGKPFGSSQWWVFEEFSQGEQ